MMNDGKIITFYSYKGGLGRTFALANIGVLLSLWGYRVLCVDWDLEAPGLNYYFDKWCEDGEQPGLIELVEDFRKSKARNRPLWSNYLTPIRISGRMEPMDFIHAGVRGYDNVERVQNIDWQALYKRRNLGSFIEKMRNEWKEAYDYVLVDSRTGITDISGICTVQLPDILVGMVTSNGQSIYGFKDVAERAIVSHNNYPFDRVSLLVLPVASMIQEGEQVAFKKPVEWRRKIAEALISFYSDWKSKEVDLDTLVEHTELSYKPFMNFGEPLPVIEHGTIDPNDIGFVLETLAALIAHHLTENERVISDRKSYVKEFNRRGPDFQPDLSVDYKNIDSLVAKDEIIAAIALGKIHMDSGDKFSAEKVFRYTLNAMKGNEEPYYIVLGNLGYALRKQGKFKEAINVFLKVRELRLAQNEEFFPWHAVPLAYCYLMLNDNTSYEKWLAFAKNSERYAGKVEEFKALYPEIVSDLE
jgi:tetratricopeptide (TPR) repeat protein